MPTVEVGECRGSLEQNSNVTVMLRRCANMLTNGVVAKRRESLFYKEFYEVIVTCITLPVQHRGPLTFVVKRGADPRLFQLSVYSMCRIRHPRWRHKVSR